MSKTPFQQFVEDELLTEGGFVNNPRDNGGATKYGITSRTLAMWRKVEYVTLKDIQDLRIEEAMQIYKAFYWDPIQGDALPLPIALLAFDAAINSGVSQSARWLQQSVGATPDGNIGAKTLAAIKKYPVKDIIKKMVSYRIKMLCKHEDFDIYAGGWLGRVVEKVYDAAVYGQENRTLGG